MYRIALVVLAAAALAANAADAKPKRIVSNGCTMEQIQSPAAAPCIDQMEKDIMAGSSTFHAVYCSSTGAILCCQYDSGGQVVDHSCTVVGSRQPPRATHNILTAPSVLAPN